MDTKKNIYFFAKSKHTARYPLIEWIFNYVLGKRGYLLGNLSLETSSTSPSKNIFMRNFNLTKMLKINMVDRFIQRDYYP